MAQQRVGSSVSSHCRRLPGIRRFPDEDPMGKLHDRLSPELIQFISQQHLFFVATAAGEGRINLSPKGIDTFRVFDASSVGYLDLTGSGHETAAHLLADGRITIMFCSF